MVSRNYHTNLTQQQLKELIHYCPETGIFTRAVRASANQPVGAVAGYGTKIDILCTKYQKHRVAWLYMTGEWPENDVDHINGDPLDNRWCNLRAATHAQNMRNCKLPRHNTSGVKGVSWHVRQQKWRVNVKFQRVVYSGGSHDSFEDAVAAAKKLRSELHGEFANHGLLSP